MRVFGPLLSDHFFRHRRFFFCEPGPLRCLNECRALGDLD